MLLQLKTALLVASACATDADAPNIKSASVGTSANRLRPRRRRAARSRTGFEPSGIGRPPRASPYPVAVPLQVHASVHALPAPSSVLPPRASVHHDRPAA